MNILFKALRFINLHNGEEEKEKVLENVRVNTSFRGSNLWILACAILIASVGLNVNSTAVIIGAMLISPLMGPIVGAGFALGTYDYDLLKKSLKNLAIATLVSMTVATLYFFVSPFKETQSELLARTSPTIYDVLIAFFGGLVGVIAVTRVEKGNPIPGVAIATALMPPLCTAGYGLAIGNLSYFLGAFYLYSINCFFICIATFLIVKYLGYEPVKFLSKKHGVLIRNSISFLILIMIIPSFYLAYELLKEKEYSQQVERFIDKEFTEKGNTIIYKKIASKSNPKTIELAFMAKRFEENEIKGLNDKLHQYYNIQNTELRIIQDVKDIHDIKSEILTELSQRDNTLSLKDMEIKNLREELAAYKFEDGNLLKEIQILFPNLIEVSIGKHLPSMVADSLGVIETVLLYRPLEDTVKIRSRRQAAARAKSRQLEEEKEIKRLQTWLQQKLATKHIKLVRIEEEES